MIFTRKTIPNAFRSLWHSLVYLVHGQPLIAPRLIVRARRLDCFLCPHRQGDQCTLCTCFIAPKTFLSAEACPDGRWPSLY
jgi:hypothetical protein